MARPLPSLTPEDAASERARLIACLARGELPVPAFRAQRQRLGSDAYRADRRRTRACPTNVSSVALYVERLDELELDLAILEAWGDAKRDSSAVCSSLRTWRRAGRAHGASARELVRSERVAAAELSLIELARELLRTLPRKALPRPRCPHCAPEGTPSVAAIMERAVLGIGLDAEVRVEPRLSSLAATGERTVFLADRAVQPARGPPARRARGVRAPGGRRQRARAAAAAACRSGSREPSPIKRGSRSTSKSSSGFMCSERLRTLVRARGGHASCFMTGPRSARPRA